MKVTKSLTNMGQVAVLHGVSMTDKMGFDSVFVAAQKICFKCQNMTFSLWL